MVIAEKGGCFLSQQRVIYYIHGRLYRTGFIPEGSSSDSRYIIITKKSFWVMSGLHINDTSFLQFSGI
jgi:hypothetical protein